MTDIYGLDEKDFGSKGALKVDLTFSASATKLQQFLQ